MKVEIYKLFYVSQTFVFAKVYVMEDFDFDTIFFFVKITSGKGKVKLT